MSNTPSSPSVPNPASGPMVIVGAGHAGGRAAAHLRSLGWTGDIVLIGQEPVLPYERPPLSKAVLTGETPPERCLLRAAADYDTDRISHLVATVQAIDPAARCVVLDDGRRIGYAALLLATGGQARSLDLPGATLPGVFALRNMADALALAPRLQPGRKVVLIGGGFIGLEVAASARKLGCEVCVLEAAPRLLGRAVPASIAERVLALHRAHGVDVRLGVALAAFEPDEGGALRVRLQDGSVLDADTIVVGVGIDPAVGLARAAGLQVSRGIVVDAELASSVPGIYAAGDAAEFPSVFSGQPIRQESWHNAETQSRTVAANMLGGHERFASVPWFWSDQYDFQLQVCGEPALASQGVTRLLGNADSAAHERGELHFHLDTEGRLVGASGCGPTSLVAKELKLARTLVERGARPSAAQLADPDVKLKSLLSSTAG